MRRWFLLALCLVAVAAFFERDRLVPLLPARIAAPFQSEAAGDAKTQASAHQRTPPAVEIATATRGDLPVIIETVGMVKAVASTTLSSESIGIVTRLAVADGADVAAGDLVVQLDDRAAKAAVDKDLAAIARDQAVLDDAQASLRRIEALVKSGAATSQAGDDAVSAVRQATAGIAVDQAALEADTVLLDKTSIRAPFAGRLGAFQVSLGALVQPGTAIVDVTEMAPVHAEFALPETAFDAARAAFAEGRLTASVSPTLRLPTLRLPASPVPADGTKPGQAEPDQGEADVRSTGKVTFIDTSVDPASATFKLRAELANEDGSLLPGRSLAVTVGLGTKTGLVLVPSVAVEPRGDGMIVFLVKADDTIEIRKVEVALRVGDVAGIGSGLDAGDRIVREGQIDLAKGAKIRIAGGGNGNPATPQAISGGPVAEKDATP